MAFEDKALSGRESLQALALCDEVLQDLVVGIRLPSVSGAAKQLCRPAAAGLSVRTL